MTKSESNTTEAVVEAAEVEIKNTENTEETLSPWYVFCSTGCGFCKKAEPVIEELNNEGYDILTLDLAEPDNQKLNKELQAEYKIQCGTPWFINAETGKGICGFRDKNVLKKWLDGEDIPEPPKPKGVFPKPPLLNASDKELNEWKEKYELWLKDNDHLPETQRKTADELLAMPRPKSEPPKPPNPSFTEEQWKDWSESYDGWIKENNHLPNLQPSSVIRQRFSGQPGGTPLPPGNPGVATSGGALADGKNMNITQRLSVMDDKLDKLMNHLGVQWTQQNQQMPAPPGRPNPIPPGMERKPGAPLPLSPEMRKKPQQVKDLNPKSKKTGKQPKKK